MQLDRNGFEVLSHSECLRLLAKSTLGRIGITSSALPAILPVTYQLIDDDIVFRTGEGSKLDAATRGAVVAFEVDDVDFERHEGWSVLVTGIAREVDDQDEIGYLDALDLPRWAASDASRFVAIRPAMVSGRRLTRRFGR